MNKKLCLLSVLPFILSSCSKTLPDNGIYFMHNLDIKDNCLEVTISSNDVINMIKAKQTFPLFFYSSTCSHCENTRKAIEEYISKNNDITFYQLELNYNDYHLLLENLPNVFYDDIYTPRILFFREGQLTYEVHPNKMVTYEALKPILNKYVIESNYYYTSSKSNLISYLENEDNCLIYTYHYTDPLGMSLLGNEIFTIEKTPNIPIVIFDNAAYSSVSIIDETIIDNSLSEWKDGKLIKTINYTLDDGLALKNYISNYFQIH